MFNTQNTKDFITFINRYELQDSLEFIAHALQIVDSINNSFSLDEVKEITKLKSNYNSELNQVILSFLKELDLLIFSNNRYSIKTFEFNKFFEFLNLYYSLGLPSPTENKSNLLWNLEYDFKNKLPIDLRNEFSDLTSHLKNSIAIAQNSIVFCAPYFSILGIKVLESSLNAALLKRPNLKILFIIESEASELNKSFINELYNIIPRQNFKIYTSYESIKETLIFHSKFLM